METRSETGYSLLELYCLLAILAILALATNLRHTAIQDRSIKHEIRRLQDTLTYQRNLAILTGKDIDIFCNETLRRLELNSGQRTILQFSRKTHELRGHFGNFKLGEKHISLRANGTASAGNIVISSKEGNRCRLNISTRGASRIVC